MSYFIFTLKTNFVVSEYMETQEVPSEDQKTFFCCEGEQALEQVAQRGCGVSLLEDAKKPSGQPALLGNLL